MNIEQIEEQIRKLQGEVEVLKKNNDKETVYYDYIRVGYYTEKDKWRLQWRKGGKHIGYYANLEDAKEEAERYNNIAKHLLDE